MTTPRPLPWLLDLYACEGGAAEGYRRAGFVPLGVDLTPRKNYPFVCIRADAVAYLRANARMIRERFAVIHASPPCQANLRGLAAVNRKIGRAYDHQDLLAETRAALNELGLPYVIEQPEQGAKMVNPIRLCGSSFDLPLRRHRLFESNVPLVGVPCAHHRFTEKKYWTGWVKDGRRQRSTVVQVYGNGADRHEWGPAMGIDWMTHDGLREAIPPAYAEFVGLQLLAHLESRAA